MSLSVGYRPSAGATYLLPSTTPSTPGLTPNASSMSSSCSLSSGPSLSSCPSARAESPGDGPKVRAVVGRTSSRPSLRHMPSWRSFASHVSRRSRTSMDMDMDMGIEMESGESTQGAYDDADEANTPGIPSKISYVPTHAHGHTRDASRGRGRSVAGGLAGVDRRSTRKGGSSGFAKALKKLSLGKLGSHVERARGGRGSGAMDMSRDSSASTSTSNEADTEGPRIDTPFSAPVPHSIIPRTSDLSPIPVSPESETLSPNLDEYFTPPTIPTSLLHAHAALPAHPSFPTFPRYTPCYTSRKNWMGGITPLGNVAPTPAPTPERERLEDSLDDTSFPFAPDIFSPRVHRAPVLRGILDSLPVSPLELPRAQSAFVPSLTKDQFPTPLLPRHAAPSPIAQVEDSATMPSLGQVVSACGSSPVRPGSSIFRLPRASVPASNTSPSIFPASTSNSIVSFASNFSLNSNASLQFTRRHSAIIRPPILPSPTPPSLITSPRSLGTPLIPPGPISPSRLETLVGAPPAACTPGEAIPDILPSTRIRRVSAAVRVGAVSPPATGLGFGALTGAGSGLRHVIDDKEIDDDGEEGGKKRLPTPGTFGLEGEAEKRLVQEGDNPYFA